MNAAGVDFGVAKIHLNIIFCKFSSLCMAFSSILVHVSALLRIDGINASSHISSPDKVPPIFSNLQSSIIDFISIIEDTILPSLSLIVALI